MVGRAKWQLPAGVAPGTWDYSEAEWIAGDYDRYFGEHPLFALDAALIERYLPARDSEPTVVADLGCGTGRALLPLARCGWRGVAIDLSQPMLRVVAAKAAAEGLGIACVRANLVELEGLRSGIVDHAICLFSTLGMIRGREHRRTAMRHFHRILRPQGRLVVHVHNRWSAVLDPGGLGWLARSWWRARRAAESEFGDRIYPYRGLPNMFLHNFSYRELATDLQHAGFRIRTVVALERDAGRPLKRAWWLGAFRAGGWIVVGEKQSAAGAER